MITKALKNFNVRQIADSGQCFRMVPCDPNRSQTAYRVISSGHFLIVEQRGEEVIPTVLMMNLLAGSVIDRHWN
ncbi:MAG: hypothetical protein V8S37_12425 [Lachnospiraceae bacterium]